jgi:trans-aconitate methyltransferase
VGTGKATVPLAERGFRILGLEPGPNLANVARARLAGLPNVQVQTVSFEAWQVPPGAFAFAYAAQAFHWFSPEERLPKFARTLQPGGALAVFGNVESVAPGALHDAIQTVYQQHAPTLLGRDGARRAYASAASPLLREIQACPLFTDATCELTHWQQAMPAADYCALLATFSDHSTLPAQQLRDLLTGVERVIEAHGGKTPVCYTTGLFLARTKRAH